MSHYDSYSYDRSDRLFVERDPYGGAAVGYADRGIKRQRSHTPAFDDTYHGSSEREWEHKRRRSRDDFERDWGSTTERSPERGRRSWNELDPKEKEREWRMYERERDIEKEWDRYYAGQGVVDERDARSRSHREERRTPEDGFRNADDSLARERQARPTDSLKDPMDSRTILTFKRFAQLLRENGKEPAAGSNSMEATQLLYEKYQEYRKAFQRRAMEQFFETHKNAPWFNEKFGISQEVAEAKAARRRQGRNGKRKLWLNDLRSGTLDRINFDVIETREPRKGKDAFAQQSGSSKYFVATNQAGEREELDEIESVVLAPEPNQLLIRSIPAEIGRSSIEDALKGEKGFLYLALGEPHPLKRYGRVGCAVFEHQSADTMLDIALRLSQTTIEGQKLAFELANRPAQVKLRVAPEYACSLPRLLHDLHQARKVLQLFESEDRQEMQKAGNVNAFAEEELDLEATSEIEQRALHVTCSDGTNAEEMKLWLSNVLDLRSGRGSETASPPENDDANINKALLGEDEEDCEAVQTKQELLRKNLDLHLDLLRKVYNCDYYSSTVSDFPEELSRRAPRCLRFNCAKPMTHLSAIAEKAKLWASNVDTKHELLMRPDDNQIGNYGGIDIKSMLIDLAAPYSREDETEKHRCIVKVNGEECGKPFKAQIFVQKHVTNKHKEWFNELMADKIDDAKFYNNYVRDPQRPMPIAQPTDRNGISTSGNPSSLGSRLGGYDHSNAAQLSAGGNGYYGGGNLVRLGLSSAAEGAGDYARDRAGDAIASGTSLRMGKIDSDPFSVSSAVPNVNRVRLDPRAAMAPKSYRDLDAGVPSGAAEIELEY